MNIYIVEDNIFHIEDLKISLEELGHTCCGTSDDPFEAQEEIGKLMPDAVLVDIHLRGKQAGIALAKRIKSLFHLPVLFTSADSNFEVISEAADIDPVAYLTKPIHIKDLQAALILAQKHTPHTETKTEQVSHLFVKNGNKLVKIDVDSILFAHTDSKNYCSLVTTDHKKLSIRSSILNLYESLDKNNFIQTHRSYIINWHKIDSFHESDQTIEIQGHHIPLGRTFKNEVYKRLKIL
ncbi:response regulator transcription factor [Aquimarina sp. MMG016]|uniref:LytR/AlgR family response regulator transcription factor n=1 Tax=Aquimarina sp. MMG016 TaxID=2822690 RepID=UPI001B3A397D|nr:response regulator transcription factor [Aquimarina sp. MMG016]MBQ4820622.1 response regulator transcription factor [Aquimarina sp. MMG016]